MPKISAVIITKNEEINIARCLASLANLVEEVLVIDAFSTDKTVAIAKAHGAKVVQKEWEGYSQNKSFGNEMAKNNWILSIDADEVLSPKLMASIQQLTLDDAKVYSFNRLNNYCGQWIKYSNWHPDWNIRLFNKKYSSWTGDFVHEKLSFPEKIVVEKLEGLLYHYSYQNSEDHWQRIEKYAQLSAQQLFQSGQKATFIKLWVSPIARFLKTYFFKKGFLDGKAGWTISVRNAYLVHRKYQLLQEMQTKS